MGVFYFKKLKAKGEKMKKILIVLMAVAMVTFLFAGCFPVKNQAPVITSDPVTTAEVGAGYSYNVDATDPDVGDTLTYSLDIKPTNMSISSTTGLINWIPAVAGDYDVVVKVSDGDLDITQSFTIVVGEPEPEPEPEPGLVLVGIVVDPKTMELFVGDDDEITSVTACYEFRSYGVILDFDECLFLTSNSKVATVSSAGLVTAVKIGTADILVSYKGKTDTLKVTVTALKPMEIIADIPKFEVGKLSYFTVEIVANSDLDKNVKFYFTLPEGYAGDAPIYTLELFYEVEGIWLDLGEIYPDGEVVLGGETGDPLTNEVKFFKVTFNAVGTYITVVEVWTVDEITGFQVDPLCFKVITAVVEPPTDGQ